MKSRAVVIFLALLLAAWVPSWPQDHGTPPDNTADVVEGDTPSPSTVTDVPVLNGVEAIVDLPVTQHVKNRAAMNMGCCVFASMDMDARYCNFQPLIGIIDKIKVGGGWPEKVDEVIRQNAPEFTEYVQYSGLDPGVLDQAMAEGRPACVTYGFSERYAPLRSIQHMVLLVHLDENWACVIDNNFPGSYEWCSRKEFLRRWVFPNEHGWAYVFLLPGPPPRPTNFKAKVVPK